MTDYTIRVEFRKLLHSDRYEVDVSLSEDTDEDEYHAIVETAESNKDNVALLLTGDLISWKMTGEVPERLQKVFDVGRN